MISAKIREGALSKSSTQFLTFAGVGAIGTAAHYVALIVTVEGKLLDPVPATMLGYLVGMIVNYLLNYVYTFRSARPHSVALSRYVVVSAIGFVANALLMFCLSTRIHYLAAQVLATGLVLVWNYLCSRIWVFGEARQ